MCGPPEVVPPHEIWKGQGFIIEGFPRQGRAPPLEHRGVRVLHEPREGHADHHAGLGAGELLSQVFKPSHVCED